MSEAMFLDDLALRLAERAMPLAQESALFIVLEAMEVLGSRAFVLSPGAIVLRPDGAVSLGGAMDLAHDETSVLEGVVETLEGVLNPVPVGVTELAVKVRTGQIVNRSAMLAELTAMLVPLNRRAARRMVGRLVREAMRPNHETATVSAPPTPMAIPWSLEGRDDGPRDTVLDGSVLASATRTSLDGRLPDTWGDNDTLEQRRTREHRHAWSAMAFALLALIAAVIFLVERVRAAGA